MIEDKDHDRLIAANKWLTDLDAVVAFIKEATREDIWTPEGELKPECSGWTWVKNTRCKYIEIRVDMRDGAFVLLDKDRQRISLKQLQRQYDSKEDPKP